jgi:hypothetical protein
MYNILINSAQAYVDGTLVPKIKANVSAYYRDESMQETIEKDGLQVVNDGQLLANLDIAFDVATIAQVLTAPDPETAKAALNEFVIGLARAHPVMSLENLAAIKTRLDTEAQALATCNALLAALEPLVIWPARIPYLPVEE